MVKNFVFIIVVAVVIALVTSLAGVPQPWGAAIAGAGGALLGYLLMTSIGNRTGGSGSDEPASGDLFLQRLDRLAEATGVPALNRRMANFEARRFRIIPAILLAAAFAGMVIEARSGQIGYAIIAFAWAASLVVFNFSPVRRSAFRARIPEEQSAVQKAQYVGFGVSLTLAVIGCLLLGLAPAFRELGFGALWVPRQGLDWMSIALLLLTVQLDVSILAVSWNAAPRNR